MGFSTSKAAVRFDQSQRTAADLRTFSRADPKAAATWLSEVASTAANAPPSLSPLVAAAKNQPSPDELVSALEAAIELSPTLFDDVAAAITTARTQATATPTLGWVASENQNPEPPRFVGFLDKGADGIVRFKTNTQTFDVDLSKTDWREELETTFMRDATGAPQLMSIKGIPSADGKRLFATVFAPGTEDFIAGRVRIHGDTVTIANATHTYVVTNPEFASLLKGDSTRRLASYDPVGVIIPGKPGKSGAQEPAGAKTPPQGPIGLHRPVELEGAPTVDTMPDGFFILGRLMQMNVAEKDGKVFHLADTGYFRATAVVANPNLVVPPQSAPGGAVFDTNDITKGSTLPATGPRVFFFAKILPNEVELPSEVTFSKPIERRLEVTRVSDQGDIGSHSTAGYTPESQPTADFGKLAVFVPASGPTTAPSDSET
jgi:hypothetical protein